MTLKEGASHEINSRWPEHKQRNVGMIWDYYGEQYAKDMVSGILLVRDHYRQLKESGATEWSVNQELSDMLDSLVSDGTAFRI